MTETDARHVKYRGVSADGRAREFDWKCGRCGTRGDMVDDFKGDVKHRQCPLMACGAVNRIDMGPP